MSRSEQKLKKEKERNGSGILFTDIFLQEGIKLNGHVLVIYKCNIDKHREREGEVRVLMNTLNSS